MRRKNLAKWDYSHQLDYKFLKRKLKLRLHDHDLFNLAKALSDIDLISRHTAHVPLCPLFKMQLSFDAWVVCTCTKEACTKFQLEQIRSRLSAVGFGGV